MSFTDTDRERLRNVLKNEDSVKEFFAKNREHFTSNMNKIKETTERRSREIKGVMDASKGLEMMGLISTATLKTISDIADVIEISLLNSIEAQTVKNTMFDSRNRKPSMVCLKERNSLSMKPTAYPKIMLSNIYCSFFQPATPTIDVNQSF